MWSNSQSLPRSPEHGNVSSPKRQMKVSVKSVSYFLSESDLNASADRPSSVLPHSWSSAVRMDTSTPLHQHPEVVCSNLTVLKLHHVPVKPAEKQKFTDGHGLPKRRGVRSLKHMMEVSLKDISYLSCEPDLNASVDHSSPLLPHSESREVRMDKCRPVAPRSKLPVLKPNRVPVKPVNKQCFTDEPSEWLGVGSNHMMKGSQPVRMDKRRLLRQHPAAPRSKLPVLKPNRVPVKPVSEQCFTENPSEWLGVGSNHMMKGSQPVRMDKRKLLRQHPDAPHSKLPVLQPNRVPVKPVNQQCFTDEPSEWLGVRSNHMMKGSVKNINPSCESDLSVAPCSFFVPLSGSQPVRMDKHTLLRKHSVAGCSNLPVLKSKCVPVKPVSGQNFTDGPPEFSYPPCESDLNASVDRSSSLLPHSGSRPVRMDKRRLFHQHPDAPCSKLPILKPNCVPVKPVNQQCFTDEPSEWLGVECEHQMKVSLKDPPCEFDLNASVEHSSSLLPLLSVRVGKSQHPATYLPILKPRFAPEKLLAGQKFIDGALVHQASKFPPLMKEAERNGTYSSCGFDRKVKSHLSLPSLPRLTSGVKIDNRVSLHVPVFTKLPALKPTHGPVQPAVPSNFMFFPFNDDDVKMKRAQPAKRKPLLLSRFHSATYF